MLNLLGNTIKILNMKRIISWVIAVMVFTIVSCNNSKDEVKHDLINSEDNLIFPKGRKIEDDRFHGTAWLQSLVVSDSTNHIAVGSVTFEQGARTKWHLHPDGQIIIALSGIGFYQEKGNPKRMLKKGDVVTCPPNVPHWHGASADTAFIQIAITSRLKGPTEWLEAVHEKEYLAGEI